MEEILQSLLNTFGLPLLLGLLFLKGIIVGKPIPISVIIPSYVLVSDISGWEVIALTLITAAATLAGQLTVFYRLSGDGDEILDAVPYLSADYPRLISINEYFEVFGGWAIFLTNLVPGFRGLAAIPAGTSNFPIIRFTIVTYLSTFIFHLLVATTIVGAVRTFILSVA